MLFWQEGVNFCKEQTFSFLFTAKDAKGVKEAKEIRKPARAITFAYLARLEKNKKCFLPDFIFVSSPFVSLAPFAVNKNENIYGLADC